jgi:hypothetical protein
MTIKQDCSGLSSEIEVEKRLLKEFFIHYQSSSYEQELFRYFLFPELEGSQPTRSAVLTASAVLVIDCVVAIAGTLFIGFSLGHRSTYAIVVGAVASIILDVACFHPFLIWFRYIFMFSFARLHWATIMYTLRHRSKFLLARCSGFLKTARSFIQRTNPACRAARAFPSLPVSRLVSNFPKISDAVTY